MTAFSRFFLKKGRGISVPGVLPHRRPQKRAPVTVKYPCSTAAGAPQRTDTATSTEAKTNKAAYCMRSEEHTSELQSLMRTSYAVFCLQKKNTSITIKHTNNNQSTTQIN